MKNRTVIGMICIAIALIIAFAVIPAVAGSLNRSVTAVRLTKNIAAGAKISADDLEKVSVGPQNLPAGLIADPAAAVGKYAAGDLFAGDLLTTVKLKSDADGAADILARLDDRNMAVTVAVTSFAGGFSGQLSNGDIVRIMIVTKGGTVSPGALSAVKVITTVTREGVLRDNSGVNGQDGEEIPASIMFSVNEEQARLLFGYSKDAEICCAFLCHAGSDKEKEYLEQQRLWFENRETDVGEEDTGAGSGTVHGGNGIIDEAGQIISGDLPHIEK